MGSHRPLPARRYPGLLVAQARAPVLDLAAPGAGSSSSSKTASEEKDANSKMIKPFCFSIACGRRHSAVSTFSGSAFAWGRDVALPSPPPEEAQEGLEAWHAWRVTQQARATTFDRPRRLALARRSGIATEPLGLDEVDAVRCGGALGDGLADNGNSGSISSSSNSQGKHSPGVMQLSATPSATLLKLEDGRMVCAGGWAAHEAQLPERVAEAEEAMQRQSQLPPLRKVARGFCFNVALSLDGRVFVCRHSGLFPSGTTERVPKDPYSALPDHEVAVDVAVGEGHIVALTQSGRVWTFGWQQRSALGRGCELTLVCAGTPAPVDGLENIVQIGAGSTYTVCLDSIGSVWMFGEGPCIAGAFGDPCAVYHPRCIPGNLFGGRSVLSVGCGDGHVLALTAWDPHHCLLQPGAWYTESIQNRANDPCDTDAVILGEWTP